MPVTTVLQTAMVCLEHPATLISRLLIIVECVGEMGVHANRALMYGPIAVEYVISMLPTTADRTVPVCTVATPGQTVAECAVAPMPVSTVLGWQMGSVGWTSAARVMPTE